MNFASIVGGIVLLVANLFSLASVTRLCTEEGAPERGRPVRAAARVAYGHAISFTAIATTLGVVGLVLNLFPLTRLFVSYVFPLSYAVVSLVAGTVGITYTHATFAALGDPTCRTRKDTATRTSGALTGVGLLMLAAGVKGM